MTRATTSIDCSWSASCWYHYQRWQQQRCQLKTWARISQTAKRQQLWHALHQGLPVNINHKERTKNVVSGLWLFAANRTTLLGLDIIFALQLPCAALLSAGPCASLHPGSEICMGRSWLSWTLQHLWKKSWQRPMNSLPYFFLKCAIIQVAPSETTFLSHHWPIITVYCTRSCMWPLPTARRDKPTRTDPNR